MKYTVFIPVGLHTVSHLLNRNAYDSGGTIFVTMNSNYHEICMNSWCNKNFVVCLGVEIEIFSLTESNI
jgi:hypothetical protein